MRKILPLLMVTLLMGISNSFAQTAPAKKTESAAPASKAVETSTNRSASYDSDDDGLGEEMQRSATPRSTPPPPPPPRPAASKEEKPVAPATESPKAPK